MDGLEMFEDAGNPLDGVEDILAGQQWVFTRPTRDELRVQLNGRLGCYNLTFLWQEEYSAMQFFCEYDIAIPSERLALAAIALLRINEKIWLGHFDLIEKSGTPCFRHTSLFRGWVQDSGVDHVEDLVEIAVAECERFYGAFSMLAETPELTQETVSFLLTDNAGEA